MKEGKQIRPEWIPSAYKDAESEAKGVEIKQKASDQTLLYPHKKNLVKGRIKKEYKKP